MVTNIKVESVLFEVVVNGTESLQIVNTVASHLSKLSDRTFTSCMVGSSDSGGEVHVPPTHLFVRHADGKDTNTASTY